jgi:predicted transcriptional regulator of viral defense system
MQSIDNKIKSIIFGHGGGWCMTAADFQETGSEVAVRQVLSRLHRKGTIRRLAQGIYDYPAHDKVFGVIPPDHKKVAAAIERRDNVRTQPTGAYAANLLGFDEQVPARIVFVTDGASKKLKIQNTVYAFRRTTPKNMALAGTVMGLIIQALRHMKAKNITPKIEMVLKNHLKKIDDKEIARSSKYAPIWIRALIRKLRGVS